MKKILLFLLLAGGFAAWLWFRSSGTAGAEGEVAPAARVEVVGLETRRISRTLDAFGVVAAAPSGEQVITAAFDCLVRRVATVSGARVAAGEVLLEIAPSPDAQLQFDAARSAHDLARKALAATQERYDLKLANSQDLLSAQQAELDARQKIASFVARGLGGDGRIVAPAGGVVGKLELVPGTLVPAGSALASLTAEAGLEARLGLEASDATQVATGQAVILHSANRPAAGPVASVVRVAGGALDPVTGAAEVRVPVPAGAGLLSGEHVRAAIELQQKEALVAPRSAVLPEGGQLVLYTVKNDRAVRHTVATGIMAGDLVEVIGPDLHDGDSVVTLGNYELTDGMAVQLNPPAAPAPLKPPAGKEARP